MPDKIFVVDDEPDMLSTCRAVLEGPGRRVVTEGGADAALDRLRGESFALALVDVRMPGMTGLRFLQEAKAADPSLPVILMTAFAEFECAVEALRRGAADFILKPFHPDDLRTRVQRALDGRRLEEDSRVLSRHVAREYLPTEIVGRSPAVLRLLDLLDRAAPTPADVLILGESGTGKELAARRLHAKSGRRGRFVPVDCGAIPESLMENEFFGHERGAYTDAGRASPGLLELADGGTLFLDEVCELPAVLQAKLLRVLQERQVRRVGGADLRSLDLRVVAATNRDIEQEVRAGRFREDLHYRLNVIAVTLPPLRERLADLPLLVAHYLPGICKEMGKEPLRVDEASLAALSRHQWPGNVRELQNVLKKTVLLCRGAVVTAADLPESLAADEAGGEQGGFAGLKRRHMAAFERDYFEGLLREHGGNAKAAIAASGLPASTFYWYLKKYRLDPSSHRR